MGPTCRHEGEREGGRGDGAGLRCGRSWAGAGPFRPVSASLAVFYFFLTANLFLFLLFQMELKTTPINLQKIDKIYFEKLKSKGTLWHQSGQQKKYKKNLLTRV